MRAGLINPTAAAEIGPRCIPTRERASEKWMPCKGTLSVASLAASFAAGLAPMFGCLVRCLDGRLACFRSGCLVDCLVGCSIGCLGGCPVCCLVGCLVCCLVGCLVGCVVGHCGGDLAGCIRILPRPRRLPPDFCIIPPQRPLSVKRNCSNGTWTTCCSRPTPATSDVVLRRRLRRPVWRRIPSPRPP